MKHNDDWIYFGGENPVTDGGIWVMRDLDYGGMYIIIELSYDLEGNFIVSQACVNINDGWYEWEKINIFGEVYRNDFEKVVAVYKFYGSSSFEQGEDYLYDELENALDELKKWEIIIE